jgi:penicillin V acylase-like amidase (Ntn superfamily)
MRVRNIAIVTCLLAASLACGWLVRYADACSRVVWIGPGGWVITGRNMDWSDDMKSRLWILPRGIRREGLTSHNPLRWTSRYGSVVVSSYDIAASDGINEKGFTANLLWLAESDYGRRDARVPAVSVSQWATYYLDNFATVAGAVAAMRNNPFQVRPASLKQGGNSIKGTVHLSIGDRTGDSAVIEWVDGRAAVYHGREFRVMTNSPTYDQQVAGLKRYQGFGGNQELPGSTEAADRFVRAAYYLKHLPEARTERSAVAGVFSVMRNVSQPFGAPRPDQPEVSATQWRTIADSTNRLYFFELTTSPNIIWVDLKKIDFAPGSGVRVLDPIAQPRLAGDVTGDFRPARPFAALAADPEK